VESTNRFSPHFSVRLNEAKTRIQQARQESFDFLGYTFGPHRYKKDGHWYLGASPSKKAVTRIKGKVGDLLAPSNKEPWAEVRNRLNQMLRGWSSYFSYGTRTVAYRAVDNYVYQDVRQFLRRRHKVQPRGTRRFRDEVVFGELGVLRLRRVQLGPRS
jgi:RNA-directed DNA polymerase